MRISMIITALIVGYGALTGGLMLSLTETSSLFLNYRSMLDKPERFTPLGALNTLTFFVLYTIFRMNSE